ncbi:MAG: glycoside hydrolase family 97 protein [Bacteroidales bacterium]|nr:glycoside hydrolase family 97 protein [Bacteroidales bacterium]
MKKLLFTLSALAALLCSCAKTQSLTEVKTLTSPDGKLEMSFALGENGEPMYSLSREGVQVVNLSRLGFELRGTVKATDLDFKGAGITKIDAKAPYLFNSGFQVVDVQMDSLDRDWAPVWGEESSIREHYNEMLVSMVQDQSGRKMNLRFRMFDDGLGFRYEFPGEQELNYFVIKEELTEFAMAGDYQSWWIPGDFDTQEYQYGNTRLSGISAELESHVCGNSSQTLFSKSGVQTAFLMKTDEGLYINVHEAALVNYPCMHLEVNEQTHVLTSVLTPDAQGWKGYMQTPCTTPWRTIQVTATAEGMPASRLVLNLNAPCAYEDVSWIHPVKYMGVWWEMIAGASSWSYTNDFQSVHLGETDYTSAKPSGTHGANNEKVRAYIDFAAQNGFDALLVEGWNIGWEDWANCNKDYVFDFQTPYPDFDIDALNAYAHSKGIKLVMHHESSSSVRNYERHMEAAYNLMSKYGYDAVKSGYVGDILPHGEHHYGQWLVNHYLYAVTEAAKHHIMVNAHEAVRPTGLCRTYPNLIGNESARGTEYQAFGGTEPEHTTILQFTRLNGGPMDFTPGIFEQNLEAWCGNKSHVNATIANQLSLYVTFYSPLQMAADTPDHYSPFMDAFQFIKDVAVDWDKTLYLDAEPGDYIIVARKPKQATLTGSAKEFSYGKDTWFVGGTTDELKRDATVSLDFLTPDKEYEAVLYADAADADYKTNPQAYTITRSVVKSTDSINVTMAPGGGFALSLRAL